MLHGESLNANHESSHLLKNGHRLSAAHEHHQYDSIDDDPPSDPAIPIHHVNDSYLENYSFNDVSPFSDKDKDKDDAIFSWGGTPGLRKLWISYPSSNMVAPSDEINQGTTSIYGFSNATIDHSVADDTLHYIDVDIALHQEYESEDWRHSVVSSAAASQYLENNPPTLSDTTTSNSSHQGGTTPSTRHMSSIDSIHKCITSTLVGGPGVIIAVVLNLFMSMSFGQAFFPSDFNFPSEVPRSIGVQMFLFSTLIGQLVMTQVSDFPSAMGMMMVENIPFMHIIAEICVSANGTSIDAFSTIFVTFGLSSLIVGIFFYLLGLFELGNAVYFFPRHVIIGCIGGIGIFIIQTGLEVSTDTQWKWTVESILGFTRQDVLYHWVASIVLVIILRVTLAMVKAPLLPPFYFISIPPLFYTILLICGISIETARSNNWFFPGTSRVDPLLIWRLIDVTRVNWVAVGQCIPTVIALTIFSLMHVPINIPSLSMSTHMDVDINKELIAHGYSNFISGIFGGLQNYLCYCNSLLYFKCKGGGKISGYIISLITAVFFFLGPSAVAYMPRVMPGCLLLHVGMDLTAEALLDSWSSFDALEYGCIVAITTVMTFKGMTAGLALGVIFAAVTFTLQTSRHVAPIRGKMCARTLRSSRWRTANELKVLHNLTRRIIAIQLQGHIFFGNATILAAEVERMIRLSIASRDVSFIVLDFTLVVGIDSSAAETILSIFKYCKKNRIRLCYSSGSSTGFPCVFPLSSRINALDHEEISVLFNHCTHCGASSSPSSSSSSPSCSISLHECISCGMKNRINRKKWVYHSPNLDDALAWCEDIIIIEHRNKIKSVGVHGHSRGVINTDNTSTNNNNNNGLSQLKESLSLPNIAMNIPTYLHQIYIMASNESPDRIDRLLSYFVRDSIEQGTVLWMQGTLSDRAVLVISGRLEHLLEEEADTREIVYPGHLVGEYGLINQLARLGTLTSVDDCKLSSSMTTADG